MKRLVIALGHLRRAAVYLHQEPLFQLQAGRWDCQLLDRRFPLGRTHPRSQEVGWFSMVCDTLCRR